MAASLLGTTGQSLDPDCPLASLGLTSTLAVQLVPAMEQAFGVNLPATLPFDAPTLREIIRYVEQPPSLRMPLSQVVAAAPSPDLVYVLGSAAQLPPKSPFGDAINPMPLSRWDVDDKLLATGRFAGVVHGAQLWDPALYGITASEALHMDPQQRLVLDAVVRATGGCVDSSCGVFVGISQVCSRGFCFNKHQYMCNNIT